MFGTPYIRDWSSYLAVPHSYMHLYYKFCTLLTPNSTILFSLMTLRNNSFFYCMISFSSFFFYYIVFKCSIFFLTFSRSFIAYSDGFNIVKSKGFAIVGCSLILSDLFIFDLFIFDLLMLDRLFKELLLFKIESYSTDYSIFGGFKSSSYSFICFYSYYSSG